MELMQIENVYNNNFFQVPRFQNTFLYDLPKCIKAVEKEINQFIEHQCKFLNILPPRITQNFTVEFRPYEKNISKTEVYVDKKIQEELKVKDFYNKFYQALKSLDKEETEYFTIVLYTKSRRHKDFGFSTNQSEYETRLIRESTFIKLALALEVSVKKIK